MCKFEIYLKRLIEKQIQQNIMDLSDRPYRVLITNFDPSIQADIINLFIRKNESFAANCVIQEIIMDWRRRNETKSNLLPSAFEKTRDIIICACSSELNQQIEKICSKIKFRNEKINPVLNRLKSFARKICKNYCNFTRDFKPNNSESNQIMARYIQQI